MSAALNVDTYLGDNCVWTTSNLPVGFFAFVKVWFGGDHSIAVSSYGTQQTLLLLLAQSGKHRDTTL